MECSNTNSYSCINCPEELVFFSNRCLVKCPAKYYRDTKVCLPCQYHCLTCSTKTKCESCVKGYFLNQITSECVLREDCTNRTYPDESTQICTNCDRSCLSCIGSTSYECKECDFDNAFVKVGKQCKILTCGERQYISVDTLARKASCKNCDRKCFRCDGPGPTKCLDCSPGNYVTGILTESHVSCGPCEEWNVAYMASPGDATKCEEICGDGIHAGQLECDDGNTINGDGCSSDCKVEYGFKCVQVKNSPDICYDIMPPSVTLTARKGNSLEIKFSEAVYLLAYSNCFFAYRTFI